MTKTKRLRTATVEAAPSDSAIPLLEIEAVIVARITVRRAAVASLIAVSPPTQSSTVNDRVLYSPHRKRSTA